MAGAGCRGGARKRSTAADVSPLFVRGLDPATALVVEQLIKIGVGLDQSHHFSPFGNAKAYTVSFKTEDLSPSEVPPTIRVTYSRPLAPS